ncbi:hypothetical protein [Cytobacillus oceanisediminis]|uniref:hypothetical protein n=1 Tax=Cytobacillus oceanisediminis TaxID=665099 RepID=UPI0037366E10
MGLILGMYIGLLAGAVIGAVISFPVGSAVGIFIERSFENGWALGIEVMLIALSAFVIFKLFNVRMKKTKKAF